MEATAVIGMNYGDEGKGHITNYFSDENTLNVRINGGSQASHAVFLSDGRSHIFHHFGSGSLRGARTLLASHFIVNPLIFCEEFKELITKTNMREVFIDPRCRITTPFDMVINTFSIQVNKKHNTCGVGINETVERSNYNQLKITARDFFEKSDSKLKVVLDMILNEYFPFRVKQLNLPLDECMRQYGSFLKGDTCVSAFLTLRQIMSKVAVVWPDDNLIDKFLSKGKDRHLVFEAGQGMLLDQSRKEFMPYLTRSNTGIKNVLELLKAVNNKLDLDVVLVTRPYLTRHGDGPIWNNIPNTFPFRFIEELTNVENEYQGKMRYGYLSKEWYDKAIQETEEELKKNSPSCVGHSWSVSVAMTCCDHIGKDQFAYCLDGKGMGSDIMKGNILDLPRVFYISKGNTERNIYKVNEMKN